MSYEQALKEWKIETAATVAPSLGDIGRLHQTGGDPGVVSVARAWAIRASLALAALTFVTMAGLELFELPVYMRSGRSMAVLLPIASLVVAMAWVRRRDLAKQMMVRALAWSTLVIGVIISVFGWGFYAPLGPTLALGSGVALMLMGNRGLGVTNRSFQPIAYRNHLQLALILATADAGTLLFAAAIQIGIFLQMGFVQYLLQGLPTLGCGLVMAIAVGGIYRLRTWALVLNLLANLGIAYVAMSGYLGLTIPVATALATTATIQLLLPVPILAVALGDPLRDRSPLGRLGQPALKLGLVAMIVAGVGGPLIPYERYSLWRSGWVDRTHRTWIRGLKQLRSPAPEGSDRPTAGGSG